MSKTIKITVCSMHEHELDDNSQPNFIGDGSSIIVLDGICKKCGLDVHISVDGFNVTYKLTMNEIPVVKIDSISIYGSQDYYDEKDY